MLSHNGANPNGTEPIERVPRHLARRTLLAERRQSILQQKQLEKQTDMLPTLSSESSNPKAGWRQLIALREENRRLRNELEEQRTRLHALSAEKATQQAHPNQQDATTDDLDVQERVRYQDRERELLEERDRLLESRQQLEQRYQELYNNFQLAVEEEAQKMVTEAARTLELSPEEPPQLLNEVVNTLQWHVRQEEDRHLVELLYYKREVQRISAQLQQEREQIEVERQQLRATIQHLNGQAEMRGRLVEARLRSRWTLALTFVTACALFVLIVLQWVFLLLLRVKISGPVGIALFAPLVLCIVLAAFLTHPISILRHIRESVPHKRVVKN